MSAPSTDHPDGNLAATYALIYSFLTSQSHDKAAAAVKKAAKGVIVLKDDTKGEDPALDEIIKWWKLKKEVDSKNESTSDPDSDSSSDSESSDSSSNDSSDSSSSSSSSSSESDSSDNSSSSSEPETAKPGIGASKTAQVTGDAPSAQSSQTLSSTNTPKKTKKTKTNAMNKIMEAKDSSSSDSSDSDSSSSGSEDEKAKPVKGDSTVPDTKVKTTVLSVAVTKQEDTRTIKKRRTSESGNAVVTVTETTESVSTPKQNGKVNGKQPRKSNTPFQRIKAEAVEFHDERLRDNAFESRGASSNDYGARASQDLIVTRGDGFRKEKNKKKRGSYRGGEITMQSHSIKFT